MNEIEIGVIRHYFDKIQVAAMDLTGDLAVGDTIHIKGNKSDVTCVVESMQIERDKVQKAGNGESIGTKVSGKVREHDKVFKVTA